MIKITSISITILIISNNLLISLNTNNDVIDDINDIDMASLYEIQLDKNYNTSHKI